VFNFEAINNTHDKILTLLQEREKTVFLRQAVEIIAKTLNIYYVRIYLADENRDFVLLKAASGEFAEKLIKYEHKIKLSESGHFDMQAGTAVCLNEIRLTIFEKAKIFAWKIFANGISKTEIRKDIELFVGSPMFATSLMEIFLPLQINGTASGVLQITFDELLEFSDNQIFRLQKIANEIAVQLV
jgi:hypothetical protein